MLSTIKPIIVTLNNLTAVAGTYLEYGMRMLYNSDSIGGAVRKTLYYGKSFVDADGVTEIHLEKVLRDFLWKWKTQYAASDQRHLPACIVSSVSQSNAAIEETEDLFFNTTIEIAYNYNDVEQIKTVDVCGAWCPAFQTMGNVEAVLGVASEYVQNYSMFATSVPPHLPPVLTSNFWLGLVLNVNSGYEGHVGHLYLGHTIGSTSELSIHHGGTYALAIPLSQLMTGTEQNTLEGGASGSTYEGTIEGGASNSAYDGDYEGGTSANSGYETAVLMAGVTLSLYWQVDGVQHSTPVAKIDTCASPFYVSWITPTGGWTSYGMEGNVTTEVRDEKTAIVNLLGDDEVLSNKERTIFSLYSGMVNKETYGHLMTMLQSRLLYVYDTARDRGFYCTAETSSATTLPSRTGTTTPFNVQLRTINSFEQ